MPDAGSSDLRIPRLLGRAVAGDGPMLICVASLHGNEPAGVKALERVFQRLEADPSPMHGQFVGLVGNRRALAAGKRFLRHDFNRYWTQERLQYVRTTDQPLEAEDAELFELDQQLEQLFAEARGKITVFDLHTTSGPAPAWAPLDDTLENREFALELPVTLVLGLEEELEGTLSFYLSQRGIRVAGFESGQHEEEAAIDRAEAAIWISLETAGVLPRGQRPEVAAARDRLQRESGSLPHVAEVRARHQLQAGDGFRMRPGFRTFQQIEAGQVLADDDEGPIRAPISGLLLMPLYQSQGDDGFFIVRPIHPLWLKISAAVRRMRFDRSIHLLPGVKKHPELERSFVVDRRWARWLALELFHLLGFRRVGPVGRVVTLTRRLDDI